MPIENGYRVARHLMEDYAAGRLARRIPSILVTARNLVPDSERERIVMDFSHVDAMIYTPFAMDDLIGRIQALLERRQNAGQAAQPERPSGLGGSNGLSPGEPTERGSSLTSSRLGPMFSGQVEGADRSETLRGLPMDARTSTLPTAGQGLPKALMVDDESAIRDLYSEVLKEMGFQVDVAENGAQGLDRIRDSFYSVIISDLKMPGVTGFELWERSESVRAGSSRRFIFTTGFLEFLDTKEYDLVAGKPCIVKPAKIEEIQGVVAGLIREIGSGTA